jgi:thioredoxin reductase
VLRLPRAAPARTVVPMPSHLDPSASPAPSDAGEVDVLVVGGGAAGLSAALVLGRSRRRVVVVDAGEPRNACSPHMHGFLTRDGARPGEFLEIGREEVRRYGVEVHEDEVTAVERLTATTPDGDEPEPFLVGTAGGRSWRARRVILASGLADELPQVPGVAERWGRDVLHCPYCHGYEVRDQPVGILARTAAGAVHQALLVRQLTDDVVVFLHSIDPAELDPHEAEILRARGIEVVPGLVDHLRVDEDGVSAVELLDGRVVPRTAVFVAPRFLVNAAVVAPLGIETVASDLGTSIDVDDEGRTSVPGLWAVGNVARMYAQVLGSADAGARAGIGINGELCLEDAARAVSGRG